MGGSVKRLNLRQIKDSRGALTLAEFGVELPFVPPRCFFIEGNADEDTVRGGHAHRTCAQIVIAAHGRAIAKCHDGKSARRFMLRDSEPVAILLSPLIWLDLTLSAGAKLLVLASEAYDEADYIRSWAAFLREASEAA